jgi:CheY-like chemotaxis protein
MEPMDGFAVYRELRRDPALREITVFVHTNKLLRGDDRDRLSGVQGYLPKTLANEEDTIRRLNSELGRIGIAPDRR